MIQKWCNKLYSSFLNLRARCISFLYICKIISIHRSYLSQNAQAVNQNTAFPNQDLSRFKEVPAVQYWLIKTHYVVLLEFPVHIQSQLRERHFLLQALFPLKISGIWGKKCMEAERRGMKIKYKRELEAELFGQAGRRDHILVPNK